MAADQDPFKTLRPQTKELITKLSLQMCGLGNDMTFPEFLTVLKHCGVDLSERALRIWRKAFEDDPQYFHNLHQHGRPLLLSVDQQALLTGWVLSRNAVNKEVSFSDMMEWIETEQGVAMSLPTMIHYAKANHLSKVEAKVRSAAQAALSNQQQLKMALEFIELLDDMSFYKVRGCNIANMDATFTSHRKKGV